MEFQSALSKPVMEVTQEAVDATAVAYAEESHLEMGSRFPKSSRGITLEDPVWTAEVSGSEGTDPVHSDKS